MTPDFPDLFVYPLFAAVLFLVMVSLGSALALAVILVSDVLQAAWGFLHRLHLPVPRKRPIG